MIASCYSAFGTSLRRVTTRTPRLVRLIGSNSSSISAGTKRGVPILMAAQVTSMKRLLTRTPVGSRFSASLPVPSTSAKMPSPRSASVSGTSAKREFARGPRTTRALKVTAIGLTLLTTVGSPKRTSARILRPVRLTRSGIGSLVSFMHLANFFSRVGVTFRKRI